MLSFLKRGRIVSGMNYEFRKMNRQKPQTERFYRNAKTGQHARVVGAKIAVNRIEYEWRWFQNVIVKRISRRQYYANVPPIGEVVKDIGWHYSYRPTVKKDERIGKDSIGYKVCFYYR